MVARAIVGDLLATQQRTDDLERLLQPVKTLPEAGAEVDPEGRVLPHVPGAAQAHDRAAATDVVDGGDRLGGERRVAEGVGAHEQAELHSIRKCGPGGQRRVPLEHRPVRTHPQPRRGGPRSRGGRTQARPPAGQPRGRRASPCSGPTAGCRVRSSAPLPPSIALWHASRRPLSRRRTGTACPLAGDDVTVPRVDDVRPARAQVHHIDLHHVSSPATVRGSRARVCMPRASGPTRPARIACVPGVVRGRHRRSPPPEEDIDPEVSLER